MTSLILERQVQLAGAAATILERPPQLAIDEDDGTTVMGPA
jgi:hypothetical protein